MSAVIPFEFERNEVRVIDQDGEPWFVATDVTRTLGFANSRQALSRLDDDERGVTDVDSPGGSQKTTIINESGLYALILTSRLPSAKRFKKWVTAEVLPSIRKTGSYEVADKPPNEFDVWRGVIDKLEAQDERISRNERQLENFGAHEDYRSIKAYAAMMGHKLRPDDAKTLGQRASQLSRSSGYKIGKQPDDAFGFVNTYHKDILERVFERDSPLAPAKNRVRGDT